MSVEKVLTYSIEKIDFESTHDDRFAKATIYAFADGSNAHTHPISLEVLERGSGTVYDIPIVCKYSKNWDDFEGHEADEVPIGFIKESTSTYKNPIRFEKVEDGRTFLVIEGIIWVKYSGNAFRVLERDKDKSVSVELTCRGIEYNDRMEVEDYVLQAVTVLGDFVRPAVKGANLKLNFSTDKEEYLDSLKFAEVIKIDNSKEAAISGRWTNPRMRLFKPISCASNSSTLFKEAYLYTDFSTTEPEMTNFKYAHHAFRVTRQSQNNKTLVVHKQGLASAYRKLLQSNDVDENMKSHLEKHFSDLGLSVENFSEFGMSKEEFEAYLKMSESVGETDMSIEKDKNLCDNPEMMTEEEKAAKMAAEEEAKKMADEEVAKKMAEEEEAKKKEEEMAAKAKADEEAKMAAEAEAKQKEAEMAATVNNEGYLSDPTGKMIPFEEFTKMQAELEDLKKANAELVVSNTSYMEKLEKMSDYEDLVNFKSETEKRFVKEQQMAEIQKVFDEIEKRGVAMSDEDKKQLMSEVDKYDSVEAWSNFAKAQVFDKAESLDGIVKIGQPFDVKPKSTSIWDRI